MGRIFGAEAKDVMRQLASVPACDRDALAAEHFERILKREVKAA
jgi:hypothetical protein